MSYAPLASSLEDEVRPETAAFYRRALRLLVDAQVPFLVGGAFAHACFTGIRRSTKDMDLFIRRADYERVAALAQAQGWHAELSYPPLSLHTPYVSAVPDVTATVLFLLSRSSGYVTGQVLPVNGGFVMN